MEAARQHHAHFRVLRDLTPLLTGASTRDQPEVATWAASIGLWTFVPTLPLDELQLVQLLQNLVANAITYSGDGRPCVAVSATRRDDEWEFAVSDEGIGIDPSKTTRSSNGSTDFTREPSTRMGIDLALCQRIVDRHGGCIRVESDGEGSTFRSTIPTTREDLHE
ncbi:ATP-binding protein [Haloprofundus halobius]|uniref:ATP-binding protein n=1 Tax=Haloprofundus halobius TaxID=2876194 RepID=UPI001CC9D099|nr:ATP-binding protein [Haloprofundus halobius]